MDGILAEAQPLTGGTATSSASVGIGARSSGSGFNGTIDDVMIWNRSLSAEEILMIIKSFVR